VACNPHYVHRIKLYKHCNYKTARILREAPPPIKAAHWRYCRRKNRVGTYPRTYAHYIADSYIKLRIGFDFIAVVERQLGLS
jgi:hypothetical protein